MGQQSDIWEDERPVLPSSGFGLAYDPDKGEAWKNDIPEECECDNTHEANNTVCRRCWDKGLRAPDCNIDDNFGDEYDGSHCPYCKSNNILAVEQVQADGDSASQAIECHDCGRLWYDLWERKGWMEEP